MPIQTLACVYCLLAVLTASASAAQATGRLAGIVRDTSGAVLPGVAVTVTEPNPVGSRTVITNDSGRYQVDSLPAGRYLVTALINGFEPQTREVVMEDDMATLDMVLAVSSVSVTMTVTATKTGAAEIESTPIAITALPASTIEGLGTQDLGGLAGFVPSVTMTQSAGGHPLVTIRGIGTNSAVPGADPSSTVYLDGVYLGRPPMAALDFMNVESVEVLRGPQGTLYGRNSVGGAIHVLTSPPTNRFAVSGKLTTGSYGKLRTDAVVNGPVIENRVMGNIALLRDTSNGFVHDLNHPNHSLGSEDTWAGRGQLRVLFGAHSLLLSGDYGRFGGVPLSYSKPISAKPGFVFDNPANLWSLRASHLNSGENIQQGASANLAIHLNDATALTSLTAHRKSTERLFLDVDATELNVLTSSVPDLQRQVSEELTIVRRTPRLVWVGGIFLYADHNEGRIDVMSYPVGIHTLVFPRIGAKAQATFGQATYTVSTRLSLTTGVRYTHEHKKLDNTGGVYRLGTAVLADPASFYDYIDNTVSGAWTPKGSLQVQLRPDTFVYVSATRGFKSGGFNTTARGPGKAFNPEFAWSYEGGVKRSMADGRVRANASVFFNDYRDLQVQSFIAPGQVNISNAGSASIRGVEAEISGVATHRLQFSGNVSWLKATYNRYLATLPGGATLDAAGNRLSNAPRFSGSASAVYEFAAGRAGTASVRSDVSWQGRVFFTPANDAIETQRPYALAHLRAGFKPKSRRWEMAIYVRNVFNTDYITGTANVPPTAITARPGEPRHWGTQFIIRY
jgi:iron complex outermembrane receptor protein